MTETTETVDETAEDVDEVADESAAEDAGTEEDNSKEESDAAEEGAADKEEEAQEEDEDEEPPTRKPRTNADWVALRRQQKLEKQRKEGKGEQGEEDDESDEDDDVNDEDAKLIDKRIEKHLAPIKEKEALQELKSEIDTFVAANPDFKPFAAKALKWGQHPSWKDIPTKQLMHAAAGDKLLSIGAKRAKAVAVKTQKTKTGTNTGGNSGGTKPVAEMTDEEFEQEIQRVKTGGAK
jgi:hypothetical protein